jgi:enoyl-CoA hydratase/carnithine racemase
MGLVNEVVAPEHLLDRTLEFAAELATYASPTSMSVIKRQVYGDWDRGLVAATDDAIEMMKASLRRSDFKEAAAAPAEAPTGLRCGRRRGLTGSPAAAAQFSRARAAARPAPPGSPG